MQRKFRRWCALAPWERRLVYRLFFLLPVTWIALRILGFNRTRGLAEMKTHARPMMHGQHDMDFAQRCAELTAIAARIGPCRANCLPQSMVLCRLLRKQGLPAQIRIGVLPRSQPFQAHAWVELDNVPLGQQSVAEYEVFDRLSVNPEGNALQ